MSASPMDAMMNALSWQPIEADASTSSDDGIPYATHEGVLHIGGFEFKCYQLNTGARVISEESLMAFLEAGQRTKNPSDGG